jgi:hypothetical protein
LSACVSSRPSAAIVKFHEGNAWVIELPKGTEIKVDDPKILAPATNEIDNGVLRENCAIVSKSYLDLRDEREVELLKIIDEYKIR